MTDNDRIAQIMGWLSSSITRDKSGRVCASWFPVNSTMAVLYPGLNSAQVGQVPMSKALEEEYAKSGVPIDMFGDTRQPWIISNGKGNT